MFVLATSFCVLVRVTFVAQLPLFYVLVSTKRRALWFGDIICYLPARVLWSTVRFHFRLLDPTRVLLCRPRGGAGGFVRALRQTAAYARRAGAKGVISCLCCSGCLLSVW